MGIRSTFILFFALFISTFAARNLSLAASPNSVVVLASDMKAHYPIIISEMASAEIQSVARELAGYLGRMSGAKFEVKTGDGSRGMVLGTLAQFPNDSLKDVLAIRHLHDGKEAFAVRTESARILLIGGGEKGVSHAAMRLLEHFGCRWFFANSAWEIVPKMDSLSVSLDIADRPRILSRRIAYGYGAFRDQGHPQRGSTQQDYDDWARHNRMASSFAVQTGHAWQAIILENQEIFRAHPEYLALVNGVRRKPQLCVSHPAVRDLATEWALKRIGKNSEREMVSMECSDGHHQCECDECRKLGSVSNRVFGLANHVAREVQLKYPGKMVGCLAYGEHSEPPSFDLEPNVYVQLTAGFNEGRYTHDELLDLWPQCCRNLGFYEYMSVWLWDFDKLPGGRAADITKMRTAIRRYGELGATSYLSETGNNWGLHGRGYYIANKLLWNPDADVDGLLADFYDQAFGPAASAMRRYYERVAPDNQPLVSRSLIGEAFRDIEEATRLAKDRSEVLARLDQLKHYLRYVHLRWLLDHEKDKSKQKELSIAILAAVYRTRYEYMNHWAAMRMTFADEAAKKFDEPTWRLTDKSPKPWHIERPVTKEETDEWFGEGLEYFQPVSISEVKFSDDLVIANFVDAKPAVTRQTWQRPITYALYARDGDSIDVEITTGVIAAYRNRPEMKWTLSDNMNRAVESGSLPQDGNAHRLVMKIPTSGTYYFEANDAGAGWTLSAEAGRPVTLPLHRGKRVIHLGQMQALFFYVPKGTGELHYFWNGGSHKLLGPDRKTIAEINVDDEIVTVPVPPDMDGKVWSLSPRGQSQLWFFNVPNCLAASPSALMLPREVIAKDELP